MILLLPPPRYTYFVSERGSQLDRPTEEIRTQAGPSVVLISGHHLDIEHNVALNLGTENTIQLRSLISGEYDVSFSFC